MSRVAIDLRRIRNAGIGRYMRSLYPRVVREAADLEFALITPPGWEPDGLAAPNTSIVESRLPYYSLREQAGLPLLLRRMGADLLHSPHFLLPALAPCRTIATLHDVIYIRFKEDLPSPVARLYYSAAVRNAARAADVVITVSEFSRRDIEECLGVRRERIRVIGQAADPIFQPVVDPEELERVRAAHRLDGPFLLYVGIQRRRKNLDRLVTAFAAAGLPADVSLVLAGAIEPAHAALAAHAERCGVGRRLRFLGHVPDEDLPAVYTLALALCFPSLYEGFGLPVLEAMACGTPVLASTATSLPEVAGDAALLVDPTSVEAIAAGMARLVEDEGLRSDLRERGLRRASTHSWERAARETVAVYREVLA